MGSTAPRSRPRVVVVGGGITGLACALELVEAAGPQVGGPRAGGPRIVLLEAQARLGGKIATERSDSLLVEGGPDSFLATKAEGLELCDRLGLSGRLLRPRPENGATFVASRGRLRRLPAGLVLAVPSRLRPLLRSDLLSWRGKGRLLADVVLPAGGGDDESIAAFFTRRLGRQAFERLVEPLLGGVYAGDARQLSLAATMPRFVEMERRHRSLLLAARREVAARPAPDAGRPGPPAGQGGRSPFVTLRHGLGELVEGLQLRLERSGVDVRRGEGVRSIGWMPPADGSSRPGAGYLLELAGGERLRADAVVLSVPAPAAAGLLEPLRPLAARLLRTVPHASAATVTLAYPAGSIPPASRGYGFVVPAAERVDLLAATFTSWKWAGRAPESVSLVRGYLGGVGFEEILAEGDEHLVGTVRQELWRIAGVTGAPLVQRVHRFDRGMPQYTVGHLGRLAEAEADLPPGLALAGASYRGVGIPDCIRSGVEAARSVLGHLAAATGVGPVAS